MTERTAQLEKALRELLALHEIAQTASAKTLLAEMPLARVEAAWKEASRLLGT